MRNILIITFFLLCQFGSYSQLQGNYIIGSAPSNFISITEAVDSLHSQGISGPVVFDIKPGTYNQQLSIMEISGADQNNTVTFKSQTNDSTDVILITDSADYLIEFLGADYIQMKYLTFQADTAFNLIQMWNNSSYNEFYGNRFIGNSNTIHSIASPSTNSVDNNIFENNLFEAAQYGIYIEGENSMGFENGNIFKSNIFNNQTESSIYILWQENFEINSNIINNINAKGVYCESTRSGRIEKNRIYVSDYYQHPVYLTANIDTTIIANNFISCEYVNNGAVRLSGQKYFFCHNTIVSSGSSGIHSSITIGGSYHSVLNNIFINTGYGSSILIYSGATNINSDYNCFYVDSTQDMGVWSTNIYCSDLQEWQTQSGLDSNSIFALPVFSSSTDFHTSSDTLNKAGIPLFYVLDDIDGEVRDSLYPDIGADEFDPTTYIHNIKPNNTKIYPNPTNGLLSIEAETLKSVKVYSMDNKILLSEKINNNYAEINISNLSKGVYFLIIETEKNRYSKKILKY